LGVALGENQAGSNIATSSIACWRELIATYPCRGTTGGLASRTTANVRSSAREVGASSAASSIHHVAPFADRGVKSADVI
jgi:hypothetical protein